MPGGGVRNLFNFQSALSFIAVSTISRVVLRRVISISIPISKAIPSFSSCSCSSSPPCTPISSLFSCSSFSSFSFSPSLSRSTEPCSSPTTCFSGSKNSVRILALWIRDLVSRERKSEGEVRRRYRRLRTAR